MSIEKKGRKALFFLVANILRVWIWTNPDNFMVDSVEHEEFSF